MTLYAANELMLASSIYRGLPSWTKQLEIKEQIAVCSNMYPVEGIIPFEPLAPFPIKLLNIEQLQTIMDWICRNIWVNLDTLSLYTMQVRMVIANNMLEKLYLSNILTKDEFIWLEENLKHNVTRLWQCVQEEDLPFVMEKSEPPF